MLSRTISSYKIAYTGLSKETWLLSLIMLINRSGTMVVPFLTLYLTSPGMGYSIGDAGLVFGCFGAGAFAGAFVGGRLTDKIGFYKVQLAALGGGAVLFFVLSFIQSFYLICLFTFLLSFVNEAFRPANSTAIAFYSTPENRTRSYSLNRLAVNLGWAVGSAMGGIIAKFSYQWLFWVDGVSNFMAAVLMVLFLKQAAARHTAERKEVQQHPFAPESRSVYKDYPYHVFIILVTLFAACFFQLFTTLSVYFKQVLHFTEPQIGMLMAFNGILIVLVEMILIYQLEGRRNQLTYIAIGVGLVGVFYLLMGLGTIALPMAFALIFIITAGEMLSMPFMNSFWINRSSAHNRGQYAALYTMAWSAAQTLGPLLSSQLAETAGFRFTWFVNGAICLLVAVIFLQLKRKAYF
jgi:predicted MFS family arabinose efflux permease